LAKAMKKRKYTCPVCGYGGLKEAPYNQNISSYEICPCCGFEFGFDGGNRPEEFIAFRKRWLDNGAKWFLPRLKPKDWNLYEQLERIKKSKPV